MVTLSGVSGSQLKDWAAEGGIELSPEAIACGDGANDLPMIRQLASVHRLFIVSQFKW